MSDGEAAFLFTWKALGGPDVWVREFRFHPTRKWRVDFAAVEAHIIVEVEGGSWSGGRHVRGDGYRRDIEKYNAATAAGWNLYRLTTAMAADPDAVGLVLEAWRRSAPEGGATMPDYAWIVIERDGAWDVYKRGVLVGERLEYSDALELARGEAEA